MNTRALNVTPVDGALECDASEAAHVPNRGETRGKCRPGVPRGTKRCIGLGLAHIPSGPIALEITGQVRVQVRQARKQGHVAEIDDLGVAGDATTHPRDPFPGNNDDRIRHEPTRVDIEQASGSEHRLAREHPRRQERTAEGQGDDTAQRGHAILTGFGSREQ